MNNSHNAVVFDLDGTLLDTLTDLTNSVNFAMENLGLLPYTNQQVRMMIGNGVFVLMQRALKRDNKPQLHAQALAMQRQHYSAHCNDNTKPYPGVVALLQQLKQLGYTVIVHTNKDEVIAQPLCQKFFGNNVDYVCGTVPGGATKPDAQRLKNLLTQQNLQAVYCGDTDVDLQTANNAGLSCIAVLWGFRDKDFMESCGATHFAQTPQDVLTLVQQLFDN